MHGKIIKRILSLLLALCITASVLPAALWADAAPTPNNSVSLSASLAYELKGLKYSNVVQNFYIDGSYMYITQGPSGTGTTYLSRLKISGNTATYVDHMTLTDCGSGETLAGYRYNGKLYFYVGCKYNDYGFSSQIARVQYSAGTSYTYTDLRRCSVLDCATADGSDLGTLYRMNCCANEDYTIFRIHTADGSFTYSFYDTKALNAVLDSTKLVDMRDSAVRAAFVHSFTQTSSNRVLPNDSFQGVEMADSNNIFVCGGSKEQDPMIARMDRSGKYLYSATITNVTSAINGLKCMNGSLYFSFYTGSSLANGQTLYYVPLSKLGYASTQASYSATLSQVLETATFVKANMESGVIPTQVSIGGTNRSLPQFLYLAAKALSAIHSGSTSSALSYSEVAAAGAPSGTAVGTVSQSDFLSMARSLVSYVDANTCLPNYLTSTSIGNVKYQNYLFMFAWILDYYARIGSLPESFAAGNPTYRTAASVLPTVPGVSVLDSTAAPMLHQLPCVAPNADRDDYHQNMSYVIQTGKGRIIVIDGGRSVEDDDYLFAYLQRITGDSTPHVDAWFMTHPHTDHYGALVGIADSYASKLTLDKFYCRFPTDAEIDNYFYNDDPATIKAGITKINTALGKLKNSSGGAVEVVTVNPIHSGKCNSSFDFDDVHIDILLTLDDVFWGCDNITTKYSGTYANAAASYTNETLAQLTADNLNNSSVVFRATMGGKTVLFTGDAAQSAGIMLKYYHDINASDSSKYYSLKSDYVQIAHHGQNAVQKVFYQAVDPDIALWPTPKWCWELPSTSGYKFYYTRQWMTELGVTSYVAYQGPQVISFGTQRSAAPVSIPEEIQPLVFDAAYYAARYPELRTAYGTDADALYSHFVNYGIEEGHCASPYFDVKFYMYQNGEEFRAYCHGSYEKAFAYFLANVNSAVEAVLPQKLSEQFSCDYYRSAYDDLGSLNSQFALLNHFVTVGEAEGRIARNALISKDGTYYHSPVTNVITAPGCTTAGSCKSTCAHCSYSSTASIAPLGHNYVLTDLGAVHANQCSRCGDGEAEAHSYVDGICACGAKVESLLSFKSATVTLESDLSLNYYVAKSALEGFSDPYVTFQKAIYDENGNVSDYEETTVNSYTEKTAADGTECYVFTFTGISAKEMSSAVSVTLSGSYEGTVYSGNAVSYSVKQYAENLLAATEDTALRTLLVDMLNYGAEAQTYFAYNTANLANADLTDEQKAWASQEELSLMSSLSVNDNEGQSIYFESAALLLEEKVTMNFYLDLDEYTGTMEDLYARVFFENAKGDLVEYTIEGTELTELNGDHVLYFDGLNAAQMRSIIGVELYSRQTASCVSQTLYYSIESYAYNKLADASLAELVTAMMRYGDSVQHYA